MKLDTPPMLAPAINHLRAVQAVWIATREVAAAAESIGSPVERFAHLFPRAQIAAGPLLMIPVPGTLTDTVYRQWYQAVRSARPELADAINVILQEMRQ